MGLASILYRTLAGDEEGIRKDAGLAQLGLWGEALDVRARPAIPRFEACSFRPIPDNSDE